MLPPSPAAEVSPRVPLRRSLLLSASALVLASLAAFVVSLYAFVYRPLAHDLAAAQLGVASEQVEARLRTLVSRAEAVARFNHDWGRKGLIDATHVERVNDLLRATKGRRLPYKTLIDAGVGTDELKP